MIDEVLKWADVTQVAKVSRLLTTSYGFIVHVNFYIKLSYFSFLF